MAYQAYPSVAKTTLGGVSSLAEVYIPLWVYSSGIVSTTALSSSYNMINKGSVSITSGSTPSSTSSVKLITLSPNWSTGQKFALEASIYTSNASSSAQVSLVDLTSGTSVGSSAVATTSTTAVLLRTGSFTLVPGHVYGLNLGTNVSSSYTAYLTKAHLVALLK